MIVEAVVFDLFHTLVDPEMFRPPGFDRVTEAARCFGVDPAQLDRVWHEEVVPVVVRSPVRPADLLAEAASRLGGRVDASAVDAADDALGRHQDRALAEPLQGVVATLRALRSAGIKTGLLSNAHERDVRAWAASPVAPLFDAVVISCDAGVAKPDPEAYAMTLDLLGVPAENAVFCGDGNGEELRGARRAGFGLVVAVTGPALRSGLRTAEEMRDLAFQAHMATGTVNSLPSLFGIA